MLAKKAGLDLTTAYHAIQSSSGNSAEFETVAPVILNGSFDTSFSLKLACKDLTLMTSLGEDYKIPNHRKICRPFGENIGMILGESCQFVVLMQDALALELGLNIHGAALSSHIHSDGYKKSISGPGAGNYLIVG